MKKNWKKELRLKVIKDNECYCDENIISDHTFSKSPEQWADQVIEYTSNVLKSDDIKEVYKEKILKEMYSYLSPNKLDSKKGKIIRDFLNMFSNHN